MLPQRAIQVQFSAHAELVRSVISESPSYRDATQQLSYENVQLIPDQDCVQETWLYAASQYEHCLPVCKNMSRRQL
jgi:hypothetical protein